MARKKKNSRPGISWNSLKSDGILSDRHVNMAIELGYEAGTLRSAFDRSTPEKGRLMLEWVEDIYFERHARYHPVDPDATPEHQQEHPAENSLLRDPGEIMDDYLRQAHFVPGSDDEPDDWSVTSINAPSTKNPAASRDAGPSRSSASSPGSTSNRSGSTSTTASCSSTGERACEWAVKLPA